MTRAGSSKNKDKKKKKNTSKNKFKSLISLTAPQKDLSASKSKSLKSLKKIEKQLKDIIQQRKYDQHQLKSLNSISKQLNSDLEKTELQLTKLASKKKLKKIKSSLDKKSSQFKTRYAKLSQEITALNNLNSRVKQKIKSLAKDSQSTQQRIETLTQHHEHLFEKINHFEIELNEFSAKQTQPEDLVSEFTSQIRQLQTLIDTQKQDIKDRNYEFSDNFSKLEKKSKKLKQNQQIQNELISRLQNTTNDIRKSIQQIEHVQQAQNDIFDEKIHRLSPQINQLDKQNQQLLSKTDKLNNHQEKHDGLIKLLQTDTGDIRKSLQEVQNIQQSTSNVLKEKITKFLPKMEQIDERNQLFSQSNEQFEKNFSLLEEAQQQLTTSLEASIGELQANLYKLNRQYSEQQESISSDHEKLNLLLSRINQFDDILQQSSDELKTHIQQLRESDLNENSEQFEQFKFKLDQLSSQLSNVTGQSSDLQTLLNKLQEQQNQATEHHEELSRHYLTQQQQLDSMDSHLLQLDPLINDSTKNKQQIDDLTDAIEQLTTQQQQLLQAEQSTELNLSKLSSKLSQSHTAHKKIIEQLQSQQHESERRQQQTTDNHHREQLSLLMDQQGIQNEQGAQLEQLGEQIKTRSHLFGIGLIAVLAVSTLLLFNQDLFEQESDKQSLIAEIKADITNETFSKINELTKQNASILNKELNQIRESIEQVKSLQDKPADIKALENNWQEKYQLLEKDIATKQSQYIALKQSVSDLSEQLLTLQDQYRNLPKSPVANPALQFNGNTKVDLSSIFDINTVTTPFYAIQLLGAFQLNSINHFAISNNLPNTSKVYQTELNGQPWYVLIYGHYSLFSEAREQLDNLPEELKQYKPWVRKLP